jgi:hypothetical protein
MIRIRDIIFDESQKYHSDNLRMTLTNRIKRSIQFIKFPNIKKFIEGMNNTWETHLIDSDLLLIIKIISKNILSTQKNSLINLIQS